MPRDMRDSARKATTKESCRRTEKIQHKRPNEGSCGTCTDRTTYLTDTARAQINRHCLKIYPKMCH